MAQEMLIRWRAQEAAKAAKSGSELKREQDKKPAAKRGRRASAKSGSEVKREGDKKPAAKRGRVKKQEDKKPAAKSVPVDYFTVNPYQQLMGMVAKSAKQQHKRGQKERRAAVQQLDELFFGQKQK